MKFNKLVATALAVSLPAVAFAQESYPNTFSSGSSNVSKFTQKSKRFNDWSISVGAGVPFVQSADLTSIKNGNGKNLFGYSAYLSVDKAITYAFGLKLQYDRGETRQGYFNTKKYNATNASEIGARTQYDGISLIGDLNFTNLFRRVDNYSPYRWALHGYAGVGVLAYRAHIDDMNGDRLMSEVKPFNFSSLFGQFGTAVKYKVSRRFDIEGRLAYVVTGTDEFDGGGEQYSVINMREDNISDNFFNATLGLTLKLGKHQSHLFWHDPLQEIYYKIDNANTPAPADLEVCKKGDNDNDGVCDDWDRQLNTPSGARVDGAGVALDTDLDGVIDLYDKCVTVPGPANNNGCPVVRVNKQEVVATVNKHLEGIEFELNSDVIRTKSYEKLDNAVEVIKSLDKDDKFLVVGATDTRGSDKYNLNLSQRRAAAVVKYLTDKGVSSNVLEAQGRGKSDLKYPECNPATKCPEWKNEANRRVYFEAK